MIAIISNGDHTAHTQLPIGRKQLTGVLSYLGANHVSDYDLKYNEENKDGLMFTLECRGVVENAIAKALHAGFRFHTLKKEYPDPYRFFKVGVYIRYFNQTKYDN